MQVDAIIARQIHDLRKACAYTLDELATRSGISRSMISLIERQETSATATTLNRLAGALGVTLADLFSDKSEASARHPLLRREAQQLWADPESGYIRRQISPPNLPSPIELVEVFFPAGQSVVFGSLAHNNASYHQQIWMLEGEMEITLGDDQWQIQAGDCLALMPGSHILFCNRGHSPARYLVALAAACTPPRRTL